jgi:hypothetical protein
LKILWLSDYYGGYIMKKTMLKTICIFTLVFFVMSMTGAAASSPEETACDCDACKTCEGDDCPECCATCPEDQTACDCDACKTCEGDDCPECCATCPETQAAGEDEECENCIGDDCPAYCATGLEAQACDACKTFVGADCPECCELICK